METTSKSFWVSSLLGKQLILTIILFFRSDVILNKLMKIVKLIVFVSRQLRQPKFNETLKSTLTKMY